VTAVAGPLAEVRPLDDPRRLLAVWEDASAVPACAVGAVVLGRCGAVDPEGVLDLPLSVVASLLAQVWTATFGPVAECLVGCPGCDAQLEVNLPFDVLAAVPARPASSVVGTTGLTVRCPATRDLLAVAAVPDAADALLARCLADAAGDPVHAAGLAPEVRTEVEATAQVLAGAAAVVVTAPCPGCGAAVRVDVDPAELLWQRLRAEVPAVLAAVADLAAAFGWSEADVLALSPARRAAYLDLVRQQT
jgi:hypothetical protein